MDTRIEKKKSFLKPKYLIALAGLLFVGGIIYLATREKSLAVARNEITIREVETAVFEDFIAFQAKVEPLHSTLLNIVEGGAVQEIFTQNGSTVTQGQPLVRLYNPNSELTYMQQETAIVEQINNLNKAKLDLRNQELSFAKDLIAIQHDYTNAKNLFELNKKLYEQEILPLNEWINTQENYRFNEERMQIIRESTEKEKQANALQISQMNQAIVSMQRSLDILRKNKQNFLITAPIGGRLSSFEPVLGKTYQQGESIGKIDMMQGYKLIADVDEYYLSKISEGQKGTIGTAEKAANVTVLRIIPEVKNGRFLTELIFDEMPPDNLRQGTSFSVKLSLSEKTQKTVIPKGGFYSDTNGQWIFVVNGNTAERRNIRLGRENPIYYEVLEGLQPGEKVITSNYSDYLKMKQLVLRE
ncbi:MAG: efflux RND transporter periplasmic adaptor subunit [Capnocytophaga sp.]|nr:efflux RND transporter periplasmic adaptor subunit [Capnocytophaga sp.]